jgi:site-specific recombinase XerD
MTNVRGSKAREDRQTVITDSEFEEAMKKAGQIEDRFFRLRALALLCLLRLTGKRRTEVAMLPLDNFKVESGFLNVTFILLKKRKGHVLQRTATKTIPLADPLTKPILNYLEYLKGLECKPQFFFPSVKSVFGENYILTDKHLTGRQVFNIVRSLSETLWPHLFRETVASDIVKQDSSIISAFRVQRRLDLEDMRTGFNYLRRFSSDIIKREEEQLKQATGG